MCNLTVKWETRDFMYMCCVCFVVNGNNSGIPRNFVCGGVQQIQLRAEDRENGGLGVVTP